ncbi:SDR family oxidoreductase [Bordetella petrii]|nr:SDR family oxidoreductase [Bordetella petrii]
MRVALITGCSKPDGIGWSTALALAASGAAVVVSDIVGRAKESSAAPQPEGGLARLVEMIKSAGGTCASVCGDVSREDDAARMVEFSVQQFGQLDILVNNAAAPHGGDRNDIEQIPLAAWEQIMAVNVRGVFLMARAAVPHMRKNRWGRIVNVASALARYGGRGKSPYAASKGAVIAFSRSLAMDVAGDGITVNCVCPGSVLTSRALSTTGKLFGAENIEQGLISRAQEIPAGRHGTPEDIAASIAFLCSEAAGYITGSDLFVDGGGLPIPPSRNP